MKRIAPMKRIVLAVACLIGAALCAMPPSYVIMVQQDAVRPHHHASFAPSRELGHELDKYGFVGGMLPISEKLSLADLKEYNVVIVGVDQSDTKLSLPPEVAVRFGKMLAEYVQGGGGVWFTRNGGYQFGKDIDALNRMLEPFGAKMLNEQIVDRTKTFYAPSCRVYWTGDIDECHPVTAGVRGLFYPEPHSTYPRYTDFTSPIECSPEWSVLVRGSGTAWSFEREKAGELKPEKAGHFSSAPPFLAVREYGKGRVVLFGSTASLYWEDTHHPFWCDGRLMAGEFGGKPGDGLTLTVNTLRWLAESSKGVYGAEHQPWTPPKDSSEVGFVPIDWDKVRFPARAFEREYQGLIGPQTSLSGGQGSPEEFIAEAQKAGYDFIAFGEELANLTPEKYERLKKVCASACQRAFRAYPGFRYYDENGCRWMVFGDRTTYPPAEWLSKKYPGRILSNNGLSRGWSWPPVILLDNHANPQRAWFQGNYKFIATAIYDSGNRLADDSGEDYFHLNNDRFKLNPVAVRLLDHPSQVAQARCGGFQNRVRWPDADVIRAYTGRYCDYRGRYVWFRPVYVSEGPSIEDLSIVNFGTTDLAVPGNDRCRLHFRASSPDGLVLN